MVLYESLVPVQLRTAVTCQRWIIHLVLYRIQERNCTHQPALQLLDPKWADATSPNCLASLGFCHFWRFLRCSRVCHCFGICFALGVAKKLLCREAVPDAWRSLSMVLRRRHRLHNDTKKPKCQEYDRPPRMAYVSYIKDFWSFQRPSNRYDEGHPVREGGIANTSHAIFWLISGDKTVRFGSSWLGWRWIGANPRNTEGQVGMTWNLHLWDKQYVKKSFRTKINKLCICFYFKCKIKFKKSIQML